MGNELQTVLPPLLNANVPDAQRNVSVEINNLVANNQIHQLIVQVPDTAPPLLEPNTLEIEFDRQYYNLFVVGDAFDIKTDQPFKVECDRALNEYMDSDLKSLFLPLNNDTTIDHIKHLPCLFANENRHYGFTDEEQVIGFGYVRDIKLRREGLKIYPHVMYLLKQQMINEAMFELDIRGSSSYNELNRMHWSIKKVDLIAELQEMRFQMQEAAYGTGTGKMGELGSRG